MYTVNKSAFTFYTLFSILKTRGDQNLFNKEMQIEMDLLVCKWIHNQAHQKILKWGKGEKRNTYNVSLLWKKQSAFKMMAFIKQSEQI